jgi:FKBP-type peptidyl-prolyl cis-trans isomerase SlyD
LWENIRDQIHAPDTLRAQTLPKKTSPMKIEKNKVVSIDYTLTNNANETLDTSEGRAPLAYLHGNGNLVAGLEKELEGKASGDAFRVSVAPEEGYGVRDESKRVEIPRDVFSGVDEVKPGMVFQARGPSGVEMVTVIAVADDKVTIDGNHPLAGETLNFAVTVRDIREATEEELQHGHVHGPGGHQH